MRGEVDDISEEEVLKVLKKIRSDGLDGNAGELLKHGEIRETWLGRLLNACPKK